MLKKVDNMNKQIDFIILHGLAGFGRAGYGRARLGKARYGLAWQGVARYYGVYKR